MANGTRPVNAPEGVGRCTDCGRTGPGRAVGEVEQGNLAGYVAVLCDACERAGKPSAATVTRSRVADYLDRYRIRDE